MRKLLNIFFVRELKNLLWVYSIVIVLLAILKVMFSSEESLVYMVYLMALMIPLLLPLIWKITFAKNLNWILLLPISKKKIFWAHFLNNFFLFLSNAIAIFLLLKIHPFFSSISDAQDKDPLYYILRSPKLFWDLLVNEPISGWLLLIVFMVIALVFTAFFGVYGASDHKAFAIERSVKKAKRNYKNQLKRAGKIFIIVTAFYFARHYLFNPFVFFAGAGFIVIFFTVERTTFYLKTSVGLRRRFLKISALTSVGIIILSFLFSLHNIKRGNPGLAGESISFMGNLSFTLNQKRIVDILEGDVDATDLRSLAQLKYYKKYRYQILEKINYSKVASSKKKASQLRAVINAVEFEQVPFRDIYRFLEKIGDNGHKAVRSLYHRVLSKNFEIQHINAYLRKDHPAIKNFGILLSKHYHDTETMKLLKRVKKPPFDSSYDLRESLSFIMGYQITDEKLYSFLHEGRLLVERKYNCSLGKIEVESNLNKAIYCFIREMDVKSKAQRSFVRRCGWFSSDNKSCVKKLKKFYSKK